jgi:hypothetical protein
MTMERGKRTHLLAADALNGVCLAVSVSESADLARLGLSETHFRLALAEIARCIIISGGQLAYGGHLQPDGYTNFLIHELERYSRRDRPLKICLAWSEHRKLPLSTIRAEKDSLGLNGEINCLDEAGNITAPDHARTEEPPPALDAATVSRSLTSLRQYMARNTQGRILIGGRRTGFQGDMPGLLEEAFCAVEVGHPLYLAGGYGGITHDIAVSLGVDDGKWLPQIAGAQIDDRVQPAMQRLIKAAEKSGGRSLDNGLSPDENNRLAVSHRPSEIATLVNLGLGRMFGSQRAPK